MLWTAQDAADHAPRASGHLDSYHDRRRLCRAKRSFFRGSQRPVPAQGFRFRLKQPARLISPRPRRIPSHPLCLLAGAEAKPAAFEVQRISISVELAASEPQQEKDHRSAGLQGREMHRDQTPLGRLSPPLRFRRVTLLHGLLEFPFFSSAAQ